MNPDRMSFCVEHPLINVDKLRRKQEVQIFPVVVNTHESEWVAQVKGSTKSVGGFVQSLGEEEALLQIVVARRDLRNISDAAEAVIHFATLDEGLE